MPMAIRRYLTEARHFIKRADARDSRIGHLFGPATPSRWWCRWEPTPPLLPRLLPYPSVTSSKSAAVGPS